MTTIFDANDSIALINVFHVEPRDQGAVVALLVEATEKVIRRFPGFISANIHRSLDGTRVVNYAQWRSRESFEAIFTNEEATRHMRSLRPYLASSSDRNVYEVVSVHLATKGEA